jgi:hypothetical protein
MNTRVNAARTEEEVQGSAILLMYLARPEEAPPNFPQLLKMWLAMYPTNAIRCYTTGTGEKVRHSCSRARAEPLPACGRSCSSGSYRPCWSTAALVCLLSTCC